MFFDIPIGTNRLRDKDKDDISGEVLAHVARRDWELAIAVGRYARRVKAAPSQLIFQSSVIDNETPQERELHKKVDQRQVQLAQHGFVHRMHLAHESLPDVLPSQSHGLHVEEIEHSLPYLINLCGSCRRFPVKSSKPLKQIVLYMHQTALRFLRAMLLFKKTIKTSQATF